MNNQSNYSDNNDEIYETESILHWNEDQVTEFPYDLLLEEIINSEYFGEIDDDQLMNSYPGFKDNLKQEELWEMHGNQFVDPDWTLEDNPQPLQDVLEVHSGQIVNPDQGFQDNHGQDRNPGAPNSGNYSILRFPFPLKLWMIVEDDTIESVYWSENGDLIIIEEEQFQGEVLQRRDTERIFESSNLKAFICLLHQHGFQDTYPRNSLCQLPENKRVKVYHHPNFQRDQLQLVDTIQRKVNLQTTTCPKTLTPSQRGFTVATRHPPLSCISHSAQQTEPEVHQGVTIQSIMFSEGLSLSGSCYMKAAAESSEEYFRFSEGGGPSVEGTSSNNIHIPSTNRMTDREEVFRGHTEYPDYESVFPSYNTSCTKLLPDFSVLSPCGNDEGEEPDDDDDDDEGKKPKHGDVEKLEYKDGKKKPEDGSGEKKSEDEDGEKRPENEDGEKGPDYKYEKESDKDGEKPEDGNGEEPEDEGGKELKVSDGEESEESALGYKLYNL